MRAVTQEELQEIAGGLIKRASPKLRTLLVPPIHGGGGGVTVTATVGPGVTVTGYTGGYGGGGGGGSSGGGGTGGGGAPGGGGGSAGGSPGHWSSNITQTQVDTVAAELAREIHAESNYNNTEYLGVVYEGTDGQLHASTLVEGTGSQVTANLSELGVTASSIVALIHDHDPALGTSSTQMTIQDDPSVNDWNMRTTLIGEGADPNFGQYILGPDSVLRYFNGSNQNNPVTSNNPPRGTTVSY